MSDDVPMEGVEDMAVDSDLEMGDFTAPTAGVPQPPSQLQPGGEPTPPPPPEPSWRAEAGMVVVTET